jgi:copper chaperone
MAMIELNVVGMTCGGCAKSVEKAIVREDQTATVAVDLASGRVTIDSDKPQRIFELAVSAAGYELAH